MRDKLMNPVFDFTNIKINPHRMYGGKNGNKICIQINGINYMLKLPPKPKRNPELSYTYGCVSEHVACSIFTSLGINAQETMLGTYGKKVCVACRDFEENGYLLKEFASLKNTIIDSSGSGYGTEIDDMLTAIHDQQIYSPEDLEEFFWDMFIGDALIGNFDRHNGNWGFLINESMGSVKIAPIYDCASSLYPSLDESAMTHVMSCRQEIDRRLYEFPRASLKIDDVKVSYADFLLNTNNKQCLNSICKIAGRVNVDTISTIIINQPLISDTHKLFLTTMIKERQTHIIEPAYQRAQKMVKNKQQSKDAYLSQIETIRMRENTECDGSEKQKVQPNEQKRDKNDR
jgi:hypothetical protein